eukprot:jgi/Chrzof1/2004/Cz10g29120.t1
MSDLLLYVGQELDSMERWGVLGDRSTWQTLPRQLLPRLKLLFYGFPKQHDVRQLQPAAANLAASPFQQQLQQLQQPQPVHGTMHSREHGSIAAGSNAANKAAVHRNTVAAIGGSDRSADHDVQHERSSPCTHHETVAAATPLPAVVEALEELLAEDVAASPLPAAVEALEELLTADGASSSCQASHDVDHNRATALPPGIVTVAPVTPLTFKALECCQRSSSSNEVPMQAEPVLVAAVAEHHRLHKLKHHTAVEKLSAVSSSRR